MKDENVGQKVALVAGGFGGIGSAAAEGLSRGGFLVARASRNVPDKESLAIDVTDESSVDMAIKDLYAKHGRLDCVVYSVTSKIENKKFAKLSWQEFQSNIESQAKGFRNLVKSVLRLDQSLSIQVRFVVVLTEYCHGKPPSMLSHYITAKYALMGLVKSLAAELGGKRMTFNTVSPGITQTSLIENLPPKMIEFAIERNPMGRICMPADVTGAICFLASDEAAFINGADILLNGGNQF